MIDISKQLRKYFIFISIISVVFITIVSNLSIFYFFTNYIRESRARDDRSLVEYIQQLYDNDGGLSSVSLMNIMHYALSENVEVRIKSMKNGVLWKSGAMMNGMMGEEYNPENITYKDYVFSYQGKQIGVIEIGRPQSIFATSEDRNFILTMNGAFIVAFVFSTVLAIILSVRVSKKFLSPIFLIKGNAKLIEEERYRELHEINTKTLELHDLSISIKELAEKLEEQDAIRKRMTSDMAHELRTPLATLQSHIEAFMDGIWQPTEQRLMIIHDEISRLTSLIKEISDLTKIENEEMPLKLEKVNVSILFNNVADSFESLFIGKRIEMVKDIQPEVEMVGDSDRLNQIFINLLSNAYKYTDEGDRVKVELTGSSKKISVIIEDTGIGISKEDQAHIFERFYRGDISRSRETGGSGIGLTITKGLVEAHKGIIRVESEKGIGTKIIINFPTKTN